MQSASMCAKWRRETLLKKAWGKPWVAVTET